jgi:WD40 repeat protein
MMRIFSCTLFLVNFLLTLSARADETIIWKVNNSFSVPSYKGYVMSFAFSPDSKSLAVSETGSGGDKDELVIWDLETKKERMHLKGDKYRAYVFYDSKGRTLLLNGSLGYLILDLETKKELLWFSYEVNKKTPNDARQVAYSSDGKLLAVSGNTCSATLRDAKTNKELATLKGHWPVEHLAFAPDNKSLITFPFHPKAKIAMARSDEQNIIVWDVPKRDRHKTMEFNSHVRGWAFSPDSQMLATVSEMEPFIRVWSLATGKEEDRINLKTRQVNRIEQPETLAYSPDGKLLAVADSGKIALINVANGHFLCWFEGLRKEKPDLEITNLAFSPDGKMLALASISRPWVLVLEIKREEEKKEDDSKEKK